MFEQCNQSGDASLSGSRPLESDMGGGNLQGQHCVSVSHVSISNEGFSRYVLTKFQNCCHRPRFHMLPTARHFSRLARRDRRQRFREGREALSLTASFTNCTRSHFRRLCLCASVCTVATYSFSSGKHNRAGPWQWQCEKWGGHDCNGARLVRLCVADRRYYRTAGHDTEHQSLGSINGRVSDATAQIRKS